MGRPVLSPGVLGGRAATRPPSPARLPGRSARAILISGWCAAMLNHVVSSGEMSAPRPRPLRIPGRGAPPWPWARAPPAAALPTPSLQKVGRAPGGCGWASAARTANTGVFLSPAKGGRPPCVAWACEGLVPPRGCGRLWGCRLGLRRVEGRVNDALCVRGTAGTARAGNADGRRTVRPAAAAAPGSGSQPDPGVRFVGSGCSESLLRLLLMRNVR